MFNFYLTKRFNEKYDSNEKILSFMKKRRAKFIIFGHSVFGNESESIACKLHLKNGIVHGKLSEQNYKLFAHESHNVFDPLKDIEILKQTETDDFELNAIQLNYAYEYLTACICLLTYRIDDAFSHFQNIKNRIKNTTKNAPVINYIKNSINHRLCICSLLLSQKALNKYYEKPEKHLLAVMKQHLDDIEKLNPNIYQFRLFSSIYYFLYSRDIDRALLCLANCNNVKYDSIWKFNKIFLKLYQKDTISNFLNAYNTYTSAFKSKISFTELNNIAEFITRTLEEEPDKKQLCFLLMLIYNHLNDQILFRKYFYEFTKTYHHILENENIQRIFLKITPNISTIEQTLGTTSSELYA